MFTLWWTLALRGGVGISGGDGEGQADCIESILSRLTGMLIPEARSAVQ